MTQATDIAEILKIMKYLLRERIRTRDGAEFKEKTATDVVK